MQRNQEDLCLWGEEEEGAIDDCLHEMVPGVVGWQH